MASAPDTAPNSQSSSFDGSQDHLYRPVSGGSFSSSQIPLSGDLTPSTSLSNPSSQEQMAEVANRNYSYPAPPSREPARLETRFVQAPVANMGGTHADYTSAYKRTADGQLKHGLTISPTSPSKTPKHDHSRTSSTTSRGSRISDLSEDLRTRLNYAAVKVHNGWQSCSISELETRITSAQASPLSTASTLRRPYESPRPGSSSTQAGGFMQSSERSTANATPEFAPHHHAGTAGLDYAYPQPTSATQSPPSAHSHSGRTYESFWREHSHSHTPNHKNWRSQPATFSSPTATTKPTAGPSLAPPVDITPRAARRTNAQSSQQPPRLETGSSNTNNAAIALANMPSTPPLPPPKTAMENDAIETLVYMSSPKNPSYHPPSSQSRAMMPRTPLRQHVETGMTGRMVTFPTENEGAAGNLRTDADIERMMDEMGDESSDSDDEVVLRPDARTMARLKT